MSSIYSIYKATNTVNGKVYIGFDSNWPNRKTQHQVRMLENNNIKFYNSLRKYGYDNFEWTLIYQSKDKEHTLKVMEPHFIEYYNSFRNGLNSTKGGEGVIGYKHNETRREKIRLKNRGRKQSQETKNKRSQYMKELWKTRKRTMSQEQKDKISKSLMGNIPHNKGKKTGLPSPNSCAVSLFGVDYKTKKEAMEKLNLSLYMLNKLLPVPQNSSNDDEICN